MKNVITHYLLEKKRNIMAFHQFLIVCSLNTLSIYLQVNLLSFLPPSFCICRSFQHFYSVHFAFKIHWYQVAVTLLHFNAINGYTCIPSLPPRTQTHSNTCCNVIYLYFNKKKVLKSAYQITWATAPYSKTFPFYPNHFHPFFISPFDSTHTV